MTDCGRLGAHRRTSPAGLRGSTGASVELDRTESSLRFAIVYPRTPPDVDGIADHGSLLGEQLVRAGHDVVLLCRAPGLEGRCIAEGRGLRVVDAFPSGSTLHVRELLRTIRRERPDVVALQFEQFAWGPRGFNPMLAALFTLLALLMPRTVRVLFAHERWAPARSVRSAIMSGYQRAQFAMLQATASRVYVPTDNWRAGVGRSRVRKLPVFSNIPEAMTAQPTEGGGRRRAGAAFIWFGSIGGARMPYFAAAVDALAEEPDAVLTYVGTDHGDAERFGAVLGPRLRALPPQPDVEVSRLLRESDESLCPYADGVSERRGTFLASLQHGCSILTTTGASTDTRLRIDAETGLFRSCPAGDPARFGALVRQAARTQERPAAAASTRRAVYEERYAAAAAAAAVIQDVHSLRLSRPRR